MQTRPKVGKLQVVRRPGRPMASRRPEPKLCCRQASVPPHPASTPFHVLERTHRHVHAGPVDAVEASEQASPASRGTEPRVARAPLRWPAASGEALRRSWAAGEGLQTRATPSTTAAHLLEDTSSAGSLISAQSNSLAFPLMSSSGPCLTATTSISDESGPGQQR